MTRQAASRLGSHVALWSRRQSGKLVVADAAGHVVGSYSVPQAADRPGPELLRHTEWCAYPGAVWQEEPEARWSIAVFRRPSEEDRA
jgi:hypothetical protein